MSETNPFEPTPASHADSPRLSGWRLVPAIVCVAIGLLSILGGAYAFSTLSPQAEGASSVASTLLFGAVYCLFGTLFLTSAWAYFRGKYRIGIACNAVVVLFFVAIALVGQ